MKIKKTKELFLSCRVAGFSHHAGCTVFPELKIGSLLRLVREEENPHDHDAVAIFYGDTHLGYVPASENEQLAMLLDMGYLDMFEVYIQMIDPTSHPEHQVHVGIFVKAKEQSVEVINH